MFERLTETQKNFRKEMKEIEAENKRKQKNGEAEQPFYSHYRRDVVDGYYAKKKTGRRIVQGISITTLIFILWNSFAIYTWINPIYRSFMHSDIPVISQLFDSNGVKQREAVAYIDSIKALIQPLEAYWSAKDTVLSNIAVVPITDAQQRLAILEEQEQALQSVALSLQKVDAPEYMENHRQLQISMANTALTSCLRLMQAVQAPDVNAYKTYIARSNDAVTDYVLLTKQSQQELVRVFEEIDMEYEVTSTGIQFTYRN